MSNRQTIDSRTRRREGDYKICSGPLHSEGLLLHVSKFYVTRDKRKKNPIYITYYSSQCKICCSLRYNKTFRGNIRGYIYTSKVLPFFERLYRECGTIRGAAEKAGISYPTYQYILCGKRKKIQKQTAALVMKALNEYS